MQNTLSSEPFLGGSQFELSIMLAKQETVLLMPHLIMPMACGSLPLKVPPLPYAVTAATSASQRPWPSRSAK